MNKLVNGVGTIIFRVKWTFMSPKEKYEYFWRRAMDRKYAWALMRVKDDRAA